MKKREKNANFILFINPFLNTTPWFVLFLMPFCKVTTAVICTFVLSDITPEVPSKIKHKLVYQYAICGKFAVCVQMCTAVMILAL